MFSIVNIDESTTYNNIPDIITLGINPVNLPIKTPPINA
jgi:hypothetical protein